MMLDDDGVDYLDLKAAAQRMGLTPQQVMQLVQMKALRATMFLDEVWVEPAILSGATP